MVLEALASGRRWGTQGPRDGPMAARRNLTARGHRKTLGMLDPTEAKRAVWERRHLLASSHSSIIPIVIIIIIITVLPYVELRRFLSLFSLSPSPVDQARLPARPNIS